MVDGERMEREGRMKCVFGSTSSTSALRMAIVGRPRGDYFVRLPFAVREMWH